MDILKNIKSKIINIDIAELKEILILELNISDNADKADSLLELSMYKTLLIILDVTNLDKIGQKLYGTWMDMIKDYWYLNGYDRRIKETDTEGDDKEDDYLEVSSIKEGDTQVNFTSKSNTININGTKYSTGTIDFDEDILREKYKDALYKHRRLRWG